MPSSRGSSLARDQTQVSHTAGEFFTIWATREANNRDSVQFSRSVVSDSLQPHESQHTRPPCPSPIPRVYSNSCPSSRWCHPAISSSVVPFSSCPQFLPASGSFPMSQLFAWGGQSTGVSASASVLPIRGLKYQECPPLPPTQATVEAKVNSLEKVALKQTHKDGTDWKQGGTKITKHRNTSHGVWELADKEQRFKQKRLQVLECLWHNRKWLCMKYIKFIKEKCNYKDMQTQEK